MSETEEQICVPCDAVRKETFAEPAGKGYELRTLVCHKRASADRLVELGLKAKGK